MLFHHHGSTGISGKMATFPNNNYPSRRNTLSINIPGLCKKVDIDFPTRRLPSCERCKRHYKTRELCREQKHHTSLPWSTVYICFTLDSSCLDSENNIICDSFTSHSIDWQPYKLKEGPVDSKMLMCADCKSKNYTRSACRGEKYGHRHLPWSTVYCVLSANHRPSTSKNDREHAGRDENKGGKEATPETQPRNRDESTSPLKKPRSESSEDASQSKKKAKQSIDDYDTNDLNKDKVASNNSIDFSSVDESRTFFLEVSVNTFKIQWLDLSPGANPPHRKKSIAREMTNDGLSQNYPSGEMSYPWHPSVGYQHAQLMNYPPYHQPYRQMYGLHQQHIQHQQQHQHIAPHVATGGHGEPPVNNEAPHNGATVSEYGHNWNWGRPPYDGGEWQAHQQQLYPNYPTRYPDPPTYEPQP